MLSPLTLRVQIPLRQGVFDTTLSDKICQWLATGRCFSTGTPVSFTNKTGHHDITEILLKVVLNTKTLTPITRFDINLSGLMGGNNLFNTTYYTLQVNWIVFTFHMMSLTYFPAIIVQNVCILISKIFHFPAISVLKMKISNLLVRIKSLNLFLYNSK